MENRGATMRHTAARGDGRSVAEEEAAAVRVALLRTDTLG